jgi:hypothetical protein
VNAPQITFSPASFSIGAVGGTQYGQIRSTVSGSLSVTSLNTSVFTIAPDSPAGYYKLTGVAVGTSSVVVIDANGNEACASVDVHTTTIVGSSHKRIP